MCMKLYRASRDCERLQATKWHPDESNSATLFLLSEVCSPPPPPPLLTPLYTSPLSSQTLRFFFFFLKVFLLFLSWLFLLPPFPFFLSSSLFTLSGRGSDSLAIPMLFAWGREGVPRTEAGLKTSLLTLLLACMTPPPLSKSKSQTVPPPPLHWPTPYLQRL